MAVENLGKCINLEAAADLSAAQYKFVNVNSSGQAAAVAAAGGDASGVLQNDPAAAGREASVMVGGGVTKVMAGGTCTRGSQAAADSSGRAVDAVSGDFILGEFLETASVAGTITTLLFQKNGRL
jgi:hypothetical protein